MAAPQPALAVAPATGQESQEVPALLGPPSPTPAAAVVERGRSWQWGLSPQAADRVEGQPGLAPGRAPDGASVQLEEHQQHGAHTVAG
mmetsp:Transcript_92748/g.262297  ORF Transcript_92748/g.262297 Transcript_92748/m.262297 type:complete len:88 (+) Transcript_92748:881-1144(+)